MMEITAARHAYPECAGFCMDRQWGYKGEYTFLHFHNSVEMRVGGETVVTKPHAVILYEPDVPQYFKSIDPLIHDWMHFGGDGTATAMRTGVPLNAVFYPTNPSVITEIVAEIESEWFGSKAGGDRMLELKAEELFIKIGRSLTEQQTDLQNPRQLEAFRAMRGTVFASLDKPWTVKEMAERVFLSESRFYALYRAYFGISPMADLINARMNSAKNMLAFTKLGVEEIAYRLGYRNVTHFIRQFREYVGVTPSRYQKQCIAEGNQSSHRPQGGWIRTIVE